MHYTCLFVDGIWEGVFKVTPQLDEFIYIKAFKARVSYFMGTVTYQLRETVPAIGGAVIYCYYQQE